VHDANISCFLCYVQRLAQRSEITIMLEWILALALAKEPDVKKWPEWECVRWTWSGDVYSRRVICLEWKKRENRWIP